ncbi:hypothetical protein J3Q64DRAFT_1638495 [Phycomyces blakesleeanus]|uniref:Uncharacterized protein n=2 Tax=Phycomyces blakesleeanus TaxID=4837 RepID=A0A167LP82_PHYB8|nr:hypothetical protein PHYBLDRAFT_77593 [Phycomyces blakesleeanus NRRL 1555(-)]OAD70836.1 hypothetical protein PHYBLDRAFT_77593 [Phycomyces blakesleeanus NRRL 1555(-)]|eukprot:XP_018288876.1 hypothetical protein PHYBLDRAFT_77593 [Phycomyces blakesleeanus NRRL 1555(-)]
MDSQFEKEEDTTNQFDSDTVTINKFIFCTRHGKEVCDKCPTDNRNCNNETIGDVLERLTKEERETKWKGDDRDPFVISHKWVRYNGKPACTAHREVGCNECFNWGEQIYKGIHGGRKPRVSRLANKKNRENKDVLS